MRQENSNLQRKTTLCFPSDERNDIVLNTHASMPSKYVNDGSSDPPAVFEMRLPPNTCDQLLILDCAYAGKSFSHEAMGRRKLELLAACSHDQSCQRCQRHGFTKQLSECMQRLLKRSPNGFSTSEMYRALYHRKNADDVAGAPYGSRPLHFDESARDYGKIWLRPQRLQPKAQTPSRNRMFMNVTFALDEYPSSAVTKEIARALRYLPHIYQTRFEKLFDPSATLTRVVKSVIWIQRLFRKRREMYTARKSR